MKKLTYEQVWEKIGAHHEKIHGLKIAPIERQHQSLESFVTLLKGLVDAINESIEEDEKPPKLFGSIKPCPICGSSYFGSHRKDGKRIYYCKGRHRMPHNEYTGCTHTWEELEE